MPNQTSEDFDDDPTAELPVLIETIGLEDAVEPLFPPPDDTAQHTAIYSVEEATAGLGTPLAELAQRAEQIPALEAQIHVLTDSTRDLERLVAEKNRRIEELDAALASLRRSTDDSTAAERRFATQLAVRDARLAELTATVERLEQEAAAGSTERERLRGVAESGQREAEALRRELAAKPASGTTFQSPQDLREDHAALTAYIAGRRAWWDEIQSKNSSLAARAKELEHELAAGAKRLAAAEAFASRESSRAVQLRAELVDYARRVDAFERERRLARAPEAPNHAPASPTEAEPKPPSESPHAGPSTAPARDIAIAGAAPRDAPPIVTDAVDAVDAVAPAVEAIAQLEAEVEYKRQQVAAQIVELRDREQRLRAATSELESARRELGGLRTEIDNSRSNVAQLERTVADKDRALEARDARIATLHEELKQRLGASEKRSAGEFSPLPVDAPAAPRAGAHDAAGDNLSVPALICLTGDAPKRFALSKKMITVGRGPQCDLQIVMHTVSREHARLTVNGGVTLIEDLGSRNGVFVNSVRVDRRFLQQGDLVMIGETEFRFIESMAH